ncbi:ubiquitin-conjugating enzyme E2 32-like [Prunus avium]|uniref:Ubiquitin-conjugating enzyme E2 32-like n=1 Tax=Prunus avium TaxID=42229 RepID=A0A6P5S3J1_PRUAV|nr:ubiquitin-conjugating enzyme E2 32-like [Prunus avium]
MDDCALEKSDLEAEYVKEAAKEKMVQLKGHRYRSVGGMMRASIYNAMPLSGVEKLVAFMKDFQGCASTQTETDWSVIAEDKCNMKSSGEKRIREEMEEILSNPPDDFKCVMLPWNSYEWFFATRGALGTEFEGGIYHGVLQFPKYYPLEPPSIMLLTENGRFKIQTKIGLNWQPSWGVREALLHLIRLMTTYPDGELCSVEYNKEKRRALAIKARAEAPKYGTAEDQKLIYENHEYMLRKTTPPVPPLSPSHSGTGGTGGTSGTGGGSVFNISENNFYAINSKGVGILDSMN